MTTGRPSSPTPPGGPKTAIRRRAAADQKDKVANARPSSTRAAGAGGSSSTMLSRWSFLFFVVPELQVTVGYKESARISVDSGERNKGGDVCDWLSASAGADEIALGLYTDESPGLKVDPVVVLVLSLVFIFSVVALHIIAKVTRKFSS
ncbi:related to translocon subunit [Rhynchosporium agropyri]|uniref:Related to translocon subunit n=1 Tax=Rhynchosporium agropyri TaxID=914238 RepID=A0A1E1KMJ7_9HELO|nr:related to translocon subunit [Rhynchosporium agropyri]